jgi:two-component system sensor histidine kinase FlrB
VRLHGDSHHFGYDRIELRDGGTLLLLHDRTQLRRLEALLAQKARLAALGETAAGLAHELRNAMGAIVGYARLVEREGVSGAAEIASRIQAEAAAMEEMLNRFLEVARPTEPRKVQLCAERALAEMLSPYAARFQAAGLTLCFEPGGATTLWFDPFWLRQALANLLENALVHVPRGGEVKLKSGVSAGYWRLSVSDNGPGIEPRYREKVLAPFVSLRPGGTGLGLALVQKVATAHDGRIEVLESEAGGARFDLLLPLGQPAGTGLEADPSTRECVA